MRVEQAIDRAALIVPDKVALRTERAWTYGRVARRATAAPGCWSRRGCGRATGWWWPSESPTSR
ncbi:MAG: hypothetical protein U0841_04310 [Chloroflexia bacterium]